MLRDPFEIEKKKDRPSPSIETLHKSRLQFFSPFPQKSRFTVTNKQRPPIGTYIFVLKRCARARDRGGKLYLGAERWRKKEEGRKKNWFESVSRVAQFSDSIVRIERDVSPRSCATFRFFSSTPRPVLPSRRNNHVGADRFGLRCDGNSGGLVRATVLSDPVQRLSFHPAVDVGVYSLHYAITPEVNVSGVVSLSRVTRLYTAWIILQVYSRMSSSLSHPISE